MKQNKKIIISLLMFAGFLYSCKNENVPQSIEPSTFMEKSEKGSNLFAIETCLNYPDVSANGFNWCY